MPYADIDGQILRRAWPLLIDHADVSCDDTPASGESHPRLYLSSDLSGCARPAVQRRCYGKIAPISGDNCARKNACKPNRRTRFTKRRNFGMAIKVFSRAIADCTRVVAENFVKGDDVICSQRSFISRECDLPLRDVFRQINLYDFTAPRIALISLAAAQRQSHLLQACRLHVALYLRARVRQ